MRVAVVAERDIERLQVAHGRRNTRSARACPLVPTIAPPILSSSSGSPPNRSAARLNPFVAVTPADVESTGKSAVPVRGITQNFAIA